MRSAVASPRYPHRTLFEFIRHHALAIRPVGRGSAAPPSNGRRFRPRRRGATARGIRMFRAQDLGVSERR